MMFKHLYNRIRLFGVKNKAPYLYIYKISGCYPKKIELYKQAFIHRSVALGRGGRRVSNERLEFLGDAVLDAVVTDIVYKYFPDKKEGFLTNTRSKIVQRESLNRIALELELDKMVVSRPHATTQNRYIYGNALEALIGAFYLDQGYRRCLRFVKERIINKYIVLDKLANREVNFKSRLLEWAQKHNLQMQVEMLDRITGKKGDPFFHTEILLKGVLLGRGTGTTKKASQQVAAKAAIKKIHKNRDVKQLIKEIKEQKSEQ